MKKFGIIGAGGMGTALAILFAKGGGEVALWSRRETQAAELRETRENARHLPEVELAESIRPTAAVEEVFRDADLVVAAVPSAYLRATLDRFREQIPTGTPVLSVVKGIENETFARPSEILGEVLGKRPIAVLSGPSHAEEIARGLPASVVVAGSNPDLNERIQISLSNNQFRVYTNNDAVGVELAGALKNILGVAAGICDGLGFGDNAKAALLTRGLVEIARFAIDQGARMETFWGLAGVGDVVTTCYSPFGRNRALGVRIGQGASLSEALAASSGVAEGVFTTRSVHASASARGIEMPITGEVYRILFEGKDPRGAVSDLMLRPPKVESP